MDRYAESATTLAALSSAAIRLQRATRALRLIQGGIMARLDPPPCRSRTATRRPVKPAASTSRGATKASRSNAARHALERRHRRRLDGAGLHPRRRPSASSSRSPGSASSRPAIMIVSFIPMILIASSYYYLNKASIPTAAPPSAGSRARSGPQDRLGDRLGHGGRRHHRHGEPGADHRHLLLPAVRRRTASPARLFWVDRRRVSLFLVIMSAVTAIGIEISARLQWFLLGFEYLMLVDLLGRRRWSRSIGSTPARRHRCISAVAGSCPT